MQAGFLMSPQQIAQQLGFFGDSNVNVSSTPAALGKSQANITNLVYFDVEIGGEMVGRIEMGLYGEAAPRTCENFRVGAIESLKWTCNCCFPTQVLCTAEQGKKLSYEDTPFHRIIGGFMVQGGDITRGNGTGGASIYDGPFKCEQGGLRLCHDGAGVLSMANRGRDTNTSQFFITLVPTAHLDGKHVVFGRVQKGMEIVQQLEAIGSRNGKTSTTASIRQCGELPLTSDASKSEVAGASGAASPASTSASSAGAGGLDSAQLKGRLLQLRDEEKKKMKEGHMRGSEVIQHIENSKKQVKNQIKALGK